jgi:hypothetical protein
MVNVTLAEFRHLASLRFDALTHPSPATGPSQSIDGFG